MKLLLLVLLGVFGAAKCKIEVGKKSNLLQLAISLNLTEFVTAIKKVGIDKVISHEGKFTIFAPTNEAFAHEKCYPSEASLRDKLRFHVAWGELNAGGITNEMTMKTLLSKRTVRLNVYNKGQVITANGRQIISANHEAHNGIIHVVSDVMSSVYDRQGSVISELEECCPHHSRIIELVKKAGLYPFLDRRGPFTFLPPDNGAFAKLHPDYINHLIKNETALRMVLLSHVVPGTIYSPGLKDKDMVKTLSGAKLCVGVKTGEVQFGTAKVQLMDVTAGNGAVHTLDTVQFPNQPAGCGTETGTDAALPIAFRYHHTRPHRPDLVSALKEEGLESFAEEVEGANLAMRDHSTVFAPSNLAFEVREDEPDYVKSHVVPTIIRRNTFADDATLNTLRPEHKLRLNVHDGSQQDSRFTVNGKEIDLRGRAFDRGVIYKIKDDQDIRASSQTLLEQMEEDLSLTYFRTLIADAGLEGLFQQTHYPWTVFAPTNRALEAVFAEGNQPKTSIAKFVMGHVLPKTLHNTSLRSETSIFTAGGTELMKQVTDEGIILLNDVEVRPAAGARPAVNGVLFMVDEPLA